MESDVTSGMFYTIIQILLLAEHPLRKPREAAYLSAAESRLMVGAKQTSEFLLNIKSGVLLGLPSGFAF